MVIDNPTSAPARSGGFGRLITRPALLLTRPALLLTRLKGAFLNDSRVTTRLKLLSHHHESLRREHPVLRRLYLRARRFWRHAIRRIPTREESMLRQIHELSIERHSMGPKESPICR